MEISTNELIELKKTKSYLETIMDNSIDVIVITDSTGHIIKINKYFMKLFEFKQDEVLGKNISELGPIEDKTYNCSTGEAVHISKKDFEDRRKMYERFVKEKTTTNWQSYFVSKKDILIPVEHNMSFFYDEKGNVLGAIGIIRDITERKQAEDQLRASRDNLENIIESSLDSIVVVDERGYLTSANNAFLRLLGLSKAEAIGKHMSEFSPAQEGTYKCTTGEVIQINDKYYNQMQSSMLLFQEKGIMKNAISYLLRKDNTIVPVEDSMVYLFDKEGMRSGAVAITRDITERKKTERKLLDYQHRLKELTAEILLTEEKDRKRFAEYLHNEIGQYLFASQMQLKLLKGFLASTKHAKTLDDVLNNIKYMIDKARSLTFELSSPILHELGFEKAVEWLVEKTYNQYNIVVALENDKQEKPLNDDIKTFLYHAIRELLTNVVKHAKVENAKVSIKKDDSHMRICVEDNGVGFNVSPKNSYDDKKEGFGLFRIKERLEQLGGQLVVESQPNRGTRISLVVPLSHST